MSYSFSFSATSKTAAREKMLEIERANEHVPAGMSQMVVDSISNLSMKDGQIIVVKAAGYGSENFNRTQSAYNAKNEMTVEAL